MTISLSRAALAVLLLGAGTAGCDVLNPTPSAAVEADEALTTPRQAEIVLNSVYDRMQGQNDIHIIFSDLITDNARHSGSYPTWLEVDTYTYTPANVDIQNRWSGFYSVINAANEVIAKVPAIAPTGSFTEARRNTIVAEAKTMRAYAYLQLVNWFGDVPLLITPTASATDEGIFPERAPTAQVYTQIVKDLTEAEAALPADNRALSFVDVWAVKGLLSRVYLYQGNYALAETKASEVIANSAFALAPLATLWEGGGGNEILWALTYVAGSDPNNMSFFAYPSNAGGRYEYAPTTGLNTAYVTGDNRKAYTIRTVSSALTVGKYYKTTTDDDPVYLVRLAEMYLNRAEARAKKTTPDALGALSDLNAIRTRAGLGALAGLTGTSLTDAIDTERRLELAFEGHRWFDLKRTGKAIATLGIPNNDPNFLLLPVPKRERDVNANLRQNPGY